MKRKGLIAFLLFLWLAPNAWAEDVAVDLILPPSLESKDAPFYRGAQVKLGDEMIKVREAALPEGQLAAFHPEEKSVIVSDKKDATEEAKGQALLEVLDALQAGAVAPAAGSPQ